MKCYIQSWLSGVFSGSLPLMNKVHLYIFGIHLALFLLKTISLGMAAIYLHFNNTAVEEKGHKSQDFSIQHLTIDVMPKPPKKGQKTCKWDVFISLT